MERLLHHNRVVTFEQMSIIRNVAKAIHSITGILGWMEHGQRAMGGLSRAR